MDCVSNANIKPMEVVMTFTMYATVEDVSYFDLSKERLMEIFTQPSESDLNGKTLGEFLDSMEIGDILDDKWCDCLVIREE